MMASLLTLGAANAANAEDELILVASDGEQKAYALTTVQSFIPQKTESPVFTTNFKDGSKEEGVKAILFCGPATDNQNVMNEISAKQLFIYPNPVQNELRIRGIQEDVEVAIYDMQGKLVRAQEGTKIDVASLPKGTYLVKVKDVALRFVKL